MTAAPSGVLLMTFGSAVTADDVPRYLRSVRRGRESAPEVTEEFRRRYALIGRSPLIDITRVQAAALEPLLGSGHRVEVGMLHSDPTIGAAVDALAGEGVRRVAAIVLAPHFSPIIMAGYLTAVAAATDRHHGEVTVTVAESWHTVPELIETLAGLTRDTLSGLPRPLRDTVPIIFTAHSLPRSVVDRDPGYIDQLHETVAAIASAADLPQSRWQFAYQSAGHTPEEWLTPDFCDLMPALRAAGHRDVLVVPTQFLADHLEILYDIDIAGREEAERAGMRFHRIAMPNTSPALIRALAAVARRELGAVPAPT